MTTNRTHRSPNERLFHQTKDVKSYLENFGKIDFSFVICPECGSTDIIQYGAYHRKKAGVPIQRFLCKDCGACFGWLPPFLLPHKHYIINDIEPGIEAYVTGSSGYTKTFQSAEDLPCSQETLWCWINTFAAMAEELHGIARAVLAKFKANFKFEKDKRLFAADFPTAHSGVKNHNLNLLFQIFILREYFTFLVEPKDFLVWLVFQKRLDRRKNSTPTRFANDQNRQIRENSCRAGPNMKRR